MPSGGITITPGFQLAPGEKVNNAKLNQLGQPVGQVDEGAISTRELEAGLATVIGALKGRNIFCNGAFQVWNNETYTGVQPGGYAHEYGSAARWVTANDANRAVTRQQFPTGDVSVPSAVDFLRWIQSANVTANPAYLGQRLEDVRRFSGLTVAFSIYLRASANLSVTPKVRQAFGSVKRTIANTVGCIGGGAPGTFIDGAASFRSTDAGAAITITGSGFTTINSTITSVPSGGQIIIADTSGFAASGLTAVITGVAGSAAVVTAGNVLPLVADTWTRLEQVFNVPDVTGKTIPNAATGSFTEFRVEVPQGLTFQIDFANAQLEFATAATAFERRLLHEDLAYARFYREGKLMQLSNAITIWKPFISLERKLYRPTLALTYIGGGTGGAVALELAVDDFVSQTINHSIIASALVIADAEIRD